jgi:hypothetical protein
MRKAVTDYRLQAGDLAGAADEEMGNDLPRLRFRLRSIILGACAGHHGQHQGHGRYGGLLNGASIEQCLTVPHEVNPTVKPTPYRLK